MYIYKRGFSSITGFLYRIDKVWETCEYDAHPAIKRPLYRTIGNSRALSNYQRTVELRLTHAATFHASWMLFYYTLKYTKPARTNTKAIASKDYCAAVLASISQWAPVRQEALNVALDEGFEEVAGKIETWFNNLFGIQS